MPPPLLLGAASAEAAEALGSERRIAWLCRTGRLASTLLFAQGVPARVIMEVLGHSQISTTMDVYVGVTQKLLGDAAKGMDAALRRA